MIALAEQLESMNRWPRPLPPATHSAAVAIIMLLHYQERRKSRALQKEAVLDLFEALEHLAHLEHDAAQKGILSRTFDYDEYRRSMSEEG